MFLTEFRQLRCLKIAIIESGWRRGVGRRRGTTAEGLLRGMERVADLRGTRLAVRNWIVVGAERCGSSWDSAVFERFSSSSVLFNVHFVCSWCVFAMLLLDAYKIGGKSLLFDTVLRVFHRECTSSSSTSTSAQHNN